MTSMLSSGACLCISMKALVFRGMPNHPANLTNVYLSGDVAGNVKEFGFWEVNESTLAHVNDRPPPPEGASPAASCSSQDLGQLQASPIPEVSTLLARHIHLEKIGTGFDNPNKIRLRGIVLFTF